MSIWNFHLYSSPKKTILNQPACLVIIHAEVCTSGQQLECIGISRVIQIAWDETRLFHETKSKHIDWTLGLKCDHRVWPWPWPWPWIFKVKYGICYISAKNGPIATKRKANISKVSNMAFSFDLGHDLDLTMTMTIWWPRSGVWIYQIVTGVTSVVGVPSTHLVKSERWKCYRFVVISVLAALLVAHECFNTCEYRIRSMSWHHIMTKSLTLQNKPLRFFHEEAIQLSVPPHYWQIMKMVKCLYCYVFPENALSLKWLL